MFPIHDDAPRMNGRPYVNYSLIGINIIIFIYEVIITSNFSNRFAVVNLYSNYGSIPDLVMSGQNLGSLFSSMFMHGSIAHLLGNMFFLYVFGDNLEGRFGHFRYLLLYLFWGILAAVAHSMYAVATGEGDVPAIGASGAISGVLGAYLIFFPHAKIHTIIFAFIITTVRIPAIAYIPFWFIMQLVFAFIGQSGGVAYLAHIGGFLIGLLTAYLWKMMSPWISSHNSMSRSTFMPNSSQSVYGVSRRPNNSTKIHSEDSINAASQPEFIIGDNFVDVIAEAKNIEDISQLKITFESELSKLYIRDLGLNTIATVIIPIQNMRNLAISDISVKNGVIRVRLN